MGSRGAPRHDAPSLGRFRTRKVKNSIESVPVSPARVFNAVSPVTFTVARRISFHIADDDVIKWVEVDDLRSFSQHTGNLKIGAAGSQGRPKDGS
jgi:hypothetical protein